MDYVPAMPELTDERRMKLVKWYEDYVDKAIAKLEGWYPDKAFDSAEVRRSHDSFVSEFTKVAIEIGYERWPWLAAAYGFDSGVGTVEKIDIASHADEIAQRAWERFVEYGMPSIDQIYPDGVIVDFRKDHENSCKRMTNYAKKLGFPTWAELLVTAGYDVRDSARVHNSFQESLSDFEEFLGELAKRYGDNPANSVRQIAAENDGPWSQALVAQVKRAQIKQYYGVSVEELLVQRGILDPHAGKAGFTDEEVSETLEQLKQKYVDADQKPRSVIALKAENPDLCAIIDFMTKGRFTTIYGISLSKYLKNAGVLGRSALDSDACEAIVEALKAKYAHAVRPNNLKGLTQENEDYASHSAEVNKWIKSTSGQSVSEFFKNQQLVSPVSRPDSLPRPSEEEIQGFYEGIDLRHALDTIDGLSGDDVVRFESDVTGSEQYDQAKNFEMLRIGDFIAFELVAGEYGGTYACAVFCGHKLGLINYQDGLDYGIGNKLIDAEAGVLVGDRVYAKVIGIAGGQKRPRAALEVFYGKNHEGVNVVNDVLLSRDGKKVFRYVGDGDSDTLDIPDGVEVIPAGAFRKLAVSHVKLPGTLREIGEHAFGLCSCREYRIPASVQKIGDGAFSFCFKSVLEDDKPYPRRSARGPVYIDVDAGNERYYSVDGSLIERDGDRRRLISLYYDGAPKRPYERWDALGGKLNVAVPDGVTSLAPYCVSAADGYSFNVSLPETLTTIEEFSFVTEGETGYTQLHISSINVPAGLVDVDIDFWGSCAEDLPFGLDEESDEGMELYECKVAIDPANPRYAVKGRMFYDKTLLSDGAAFDASSSEGNLDDEHLPRTRVYAHEVFSLDAYEVDPAMFNVESLTFDKGQRAAAPEFTVAIPDGWHVFNARKEGERAFRAYADDSVTWDDIDDGEYAYDGLFYCPVPGSDDEDVKKGMQDHGIDEFVRAISRLIRDGDGNPMAARTKYIDFVRARNCYVMVVDDRPYDEGYCVQIQPCMPFSNSYVRLNCPNQSADDADAAFAKALEIAKTVELTDPLVCDRVAAVDKCKGEKVGAEEFAIAVAGVANTLDAARKLEREAVDQRFLREAKQQMAAGATSFPEVMDRNHHVVLDYYSDFAERAIRYYFDFMDAYGFQKASGASADELRKMIGAIDGAMILFDARFTVDDPEEQAKVDALGNVRKPADWAKLRAMIDAEIGVDASDNGDESADGASQEKADGELVADAVDDAAIGVAAADVPAIDQALFAVTMLSGDWIWFCDDKITWDGEHHGILRTDLNADKLADLMGFVNSEFPGRFESNRDVVLFFAKLALEVEKDDALRVPRAMIAPGLQGALREGDLTGLTLLNLAACGAAIMLQKQGDGVYLLIYDSRLGAGIPNFFDLCARLIWDLRAASPDGESSPKTTPFTLAFAGARNFDANEFFGDVEKPVGGAQQNPITMHVTEAPQVVICDGEVEDGSALGSDAKAQDGSEPDGSADAPDPDVADEAAVDDTPIPEEISEKAADEGASVSDAAEEAAADVAVEEADVDAPAPEEAAEVDNITPYKEAAKRMADLRNKYVKTCNSIDRLNNDIPAVEARIATSRAEVNKLSAQVASLKKDIEEHSFLAKLQGKPAQLEKLESELAKTRAQLARREKCWGQLFASLEIPEARDESEADYLANLEKELGDELLQACDEAAEADSRLTKEERAEVFPGRPSTRGADWQSRRSTYDHIVEEMSANPKKHDSWYEDVFSGKYRWYIDIDLAARGEVLAEANRFLAKAAVMLRRQIFEGEFASLKDIKSKSLPFATVQPVLRKPLLDDGALTDFIVLLAMVCVKFKGISYNASGALAIPHLDYAGSGPSYRTWFEVKPVISMYGCFGVRLSTPFASTYYPLPEALRDFQGYYIDID